MRGHPVSVANGGRISQASGACHGPILLRIRLFLRQHAVVPVGDMTVYSMA